MILATYQPLNGIYEDSRNNELKEYLGYNPIFCFKADTQMEAIVYSIIFNQEYSERLIFFETDDYKEIDIVQWNKKMALENKGEDSSEISIDKCFGRSLEFYKMYIVKDIKNKIFEINLLESLFMNFGSNEIDSRLNNVVIEITDLLKSYALYYCKDVSHVNIDKDTKYDSLSLQDKIFLKEGFQYFLLPMIYASVFGIDLSDVINFDYQMFVQGGTQLRVAQFSDFDMSVKHKNYKHMDQILQEIKNCSRSTLASDSQKELRVNNKKKIQPNEPCPCGSGKKYKKCCGK